MAINGSVKYVHCYEDGSGFLELVGEERGQPQLSFNTAPHDVTALNGLQVWGGSGELMHGETKIADRLGYTSINFVVDSLGEVVAKEKNRRGTKALSKIGVFHS